MLKHQDTMLSDQLFCCFDGQRGNEAPDPIKKQNKQRGEHSQIKSGNPFVCLVGKDHKELNRGGKEA